jgi:hypothetical protein
MRQTGSVRGCLQLSFGSRAKCLVSRAATALHYCHILLFSQGRLLVGKTITVGNPWEFGSVPHDPMGICRRNRQLSLFVRLRITWLDRNLPKKQTTTAGPPNTPPGCTVTLNVWHRSSKRKEICHRWYCWRRKGINCRNFGFKKTKGHTGNV